MRDTARSPSLTRLLEGPYSHHGSRSTLAMVARAATLVWLVVSAVNFVVWLLVCLFSQSLDSPWFLWSLVTGGIVVAGIHMAARSYEGHRPPDGRAEQQARADDDLTDW